MKILLNKKEKEKRLKEIKKELVSFDEGGELSDHVYRSYHGSYKITYARFNAFWFLYLSLYLVGKIKRVNFQSRDEEVFLKEIPKHLLKSSFTERVYKEVVENDFYKHQGKTGWHDIDKYFLSYLGYLTFFKTILECLVKYIKMKRENLPYLRMIQEWEGVAEYFLGDLGRG